MTLIDNLKQMKRKGRFVVSIDYVLNALRSTENDYKPKVDELPIEDSKAV